MHVGTFQPCHTHLAWESTVVTRAMAKSSVGRWKARRRNLPLGWRGSDRSTCGEKKEWKSLIFNIQLINFVSTNITSIYITTQIQNAENWQKKEKNFSFFLCGTLPKPWTQHTTHYRSPQAPWACRGFSKASKGLTWRYIFQRQPRFRWAVRLLLWR